MYIKDKIYNVLVVQEDLLNRYAEHYEKLDSDITGHSLNENCWKGILNNSHLLRNHGTLINRSISMSENSLYCSFNEKINNKVPGPDGILTKLFKAFFNSESTTYSQNDPNQQINYTSCTKCLFLLFNKIWDDDFPD